MGEGMKSKTSFCVAEENSWWLWLWEVVLQSYLFGRVFVVCAPNRQMKKVCVWINFSEIVFKDDVALCPTLGSRCFISSVNTLFR